MLYSLQEERFHHHMNLPTTHVSAYKFKNVHYPDILQMACIIHSETSKNYWSNVDKRVIDSDKSHLFLLDWFLHPRTAAVKPSCLTTYFFVFQKSQQCKMIILCVLHVCLHTSTYENRREGKKRACLFHLPEVQLSSELSGSRCHKPTRPFARLTPPGILQVFRNSSQLNTGISQQP